MITRFWIVIWKTLWFDFSVWSLCSRVRNFEQISLLQRQKCKWLAMYQKVSKNWRILNLLIRYTVPPSKWEQRSSQIFKCSYYTGLTTQYVTLRRLLLFIGLSNTFFSFSIGLQWCKNWNTSAEPIYSFETHLVEISFTHQECTVFRFP